MLQTWWRLSKWIILKNEFIKFDIPPLSNVVFLLIFSPKNFLGYVIFIRVPQRMMDTLHIKRMHLEYKETGSLRYAPALWAVEQQCLQPTEHGAGVLNSRLDLLQEGDCFPAVDEAVIVRQCNVHHGSHNNLSRNDNRRVTAGTDMLRGTWWVTPPPEQITIWGTYYICYNVKYLEV